MPVPATTGVLRTTIQDMEIGDYIVCNYQANSGTGGAFSNLGGEIDTEIPINGSETPNGSFYFIKVNKGLLVADRVVQHSISWNVLNGAKYIEGCPWDVSAIPPMTSNTTPSGVASASSIYNSSYDAWNAFCGNDSSTPYPWNTANGVKTGWISYQFENPIVIKKYTIKATFNSADISSSPKSWIFEGSHDNISWEILDVKNNQPAWSVNEVRGFSIDNDVSYLSYRIRVLENHGGPYVIINRIKMMKEINIIRSLSGGVTYSDRFGNSSTTDQGYGGWPANNEWDKYIANFPRNLIQYGKTLDDVFHHISGGVYTWCQETAMLGMKAGENVANTSDKRIIRGRNNDFQISWETYNINTNLVGFRPVLEYKEV